MIPRAAATSTNVYKVGQNTTRLLLACTDLLVGWLLLRQAEVATAALARDDVSAKDRVVLRRQGRRGPVLRRVDAAQDLRRAGRSPRPPTTP